MKSTYFVFRQLTIVYLLFELLSSSTFAQEVESSILKKNVSLNAESKSIYATNHAFEIGDILYSIQTNKENIVGVTVVNNQVIVSSGGNSSEASNDNTFFVYNFEGSLLNTFPQGSSSGFGFRDLAFDGTYILASEDNSIKKIDPVTFQIVGSIPNNANNPHRGLAYDQVDNAIWSTNGSSGPILKINATTGNTISQMSNPLTYLKPYGIAFDRLTSQQNPYLWLAEPWIYGSFRLSKLDVTDGLIYYTLDLFNALGKPDSCLSGGLEIINDHPTYPGKVIAVVVEQKSKSILFVDITDTPMPENVGLVDMSFFGGWVNGAVVQPVINGFAFVFRANKLNILDLSNNDEQVSSLSFPAELYNGTLANDYLYIGYANWEENYKKKIEIVDISNKTAPINRGSFETSRIDENGITKLIYSNNYLYILTGNNDTKKIIVLDVTNPLAPSYVSNITGPFIDFDVVGNLLYILNGALNKFIIYDATDKNNFQEKGSLDVSNRLKIDVIGNYAYILCTKELKIIDVSNSQLPVEAGHYEISTGLLFDFFISNTTAFIFNFNSKDLLAVDIANPSNTALISQLNIGGTWRRISGFYSNKLYLAQDGVFPHVNYSNLSSPTLINDNKAPGMISGNVQFGDKLIIAGDNKIWIYTIDANGKQVLDNTIDVTNINKVGTDGTYLFAADSENKLYIYNSSFQLLSSYTAGDNIYNIAAKNNYIYLLLYNTTGMEIIDYNIPEAPVKKTTYNLPYNGKSISFSSDGQTLLVASNKTTIGGNIQGYFQSINISNPANPVLLSNKQITGGNAIYNLHANSNTLFIGGSNRNGWFPLEAWDIIDPSNPVLIAKTMFQFPSALSDILFKDNYIYASLPSAGKIVSYRWDSVVQNFIPGPEVTLPEPVTLSIFSKTIVNSLMKSNQNTQNNMVTDFIISTNGAEYNQIVKGSKGVGITEIQKLTKLPPPVGKVTLDIHVNPPSAFENGCTTIPEPGNHDYDVNSNINVYAVPNQAKGWYFTHWTGDVSGKELIAGLIMNRNKFALAHFAELELTVSGSEDKKFYCASQINEQKRYVMLPVTLCASEADDWTVSKIDFLTKGTGNEATDISQVNVFREGQNIFTGKFEIDNGKIEASFHPPLSIKAGECVTIYFDYDFPLLNINTYANDKPKTFLVETSGVLATPVHYEGGKISGKAQTDTFTVGRIYNSKKIAFSRIQESISSPKTVTGDTCFVCPGEYKESVNLDKSVSLLSLEGAEKTTINGESSSVLSVMYGNSVEGFTLTGKSENNDADISMVQAISFNFAKNRTLLDRILVAASFNPTFSENKFYNLKTFEFLGVAGGKLENNQAIGGEPVISLFGSPEFEIVGNSNFFLEIKPGYFGEESNSNFISNNTLTGITLLRTAFNKIIGNTISGSKTYGIALLDRVDLVSLDNILEDNNIFSCALSGIAIQNTLNTVITCNKIHGNGVNGLLISNGRGTEVYKNTIYNNKKDGIHNSKSERTKIYDNSINMHQADSSHGIYISGSNNTKVYSNRIWRNCTGIEVVSSPSTVIGLNNINDALCLFTGISINNSNPEIIGNTITNNNGNGIFMENAALPLIKSNNIFGNNGSGVNNADPSVTIDASSNWWGNENGPSGNDLVGNFNVSTWLQYKVSLVSVIAEDTLHIASGQSDSVNVFFQNYQFPNDVLDISISEQQGWITSQKSFTTQLNDSSARFTPIVFSIPAMVNENTIDKIIVTSQSRSNSNNEVKDSFFVSIYQTKLQKMFVVPDSATITPGDSLQLSVLAFDQYDKIITVNPIWQASIGTIVTNGRFKCNIQGIAIITATDPESGLKATATIFIDNAVTVKNKKIIPTEYFLFQNYPNPFNPTTTIRFALPARSHVMVDVYNILGQRVVKLTDQIKEAGFHEVQWETKGQSTGVYIYSIYAKSEDRVNDFRAVKKMLLLK